MAQQSSHGSMKKHWANSDRENAKKKKIAKVGVSISLFLSKILKIHKELHTLFSNYSMALEAYIADRLKAVPSVLLPTQ